MIDPNKLTLLHQRAMRLAHAADAESDPAGRLALSRKAFEAERQAAESLFEALDEEPSRSVLYRSAAVLALDCRDTRAAEQLAAAGLAGAPPDDIAGELREVLDRAHFQRYLDMSHIDLKDDELGLIMVGPATVTGFASEQAFFPRYRAAQSLFYRTAERLAGAPFGERPRKETKDQFTWFIAPPREASFAVTVRIGRNLSFPGTSYTEQVIEEVVECMNLFERGQERALDDRMPAEYRRNFDALADQLAPDGQNVKLVGLTAGPSDKPKWAEVTRTSRKPAGVSTVAVPEMQQALDTGRVAVRGTLAWANSVRKPKVRKIKVETPEGKVYTVAVPGELMHDVVGPYYEEDVVIVFEVRKRGAHKFISITPA